MCGKDSGYSMYTCRVENVCKEYKPDKPSYSVEDYEKAEDAKPKFHGQESNAPALDIAMEIYRENMWNIISVLSFKHKRTLLVF